MATLIIVEFASSVIFPTAGVPVAMQPPVATQTVVLGSSSVMCAAFNQNTNVVRLQSDTNCAVQFTPIGTTVATATATSMPLVASQPEYFGVQLNAIPLGTGVAMAMALAAMTTA